MFSKFSSIAVCLGFIAATGLVQEAQAQCADCELIGCQPDYVLLRPSPSGTHAWFDGYFCLRGSCPGNCNPQFSDGTKGTDPSELVAALEEPVARNDARAIYAVISTAPRQVLMNSRRNAVQVRACRGDGVIAHLPLRADVFAQVLVMSETAMNIAANMTYATP